MKLLKLISILAVIGSMVITPGCGKFRSPTEPASDEQSELSLPAKPAPPEDDQSKANDLLESWYAEMTYDLGSPSNGTIDINDVADFTTTGTDIIPNRRNAKRCTIEILARKYGPTIDFPNGKMEFEFQPCGISFNPPATLNLRWKNLDNVNEFDVLSLFYYDPKTNTWSKQSDSNDISSSIYHWSKNNFRVEFQVPHFSLWAISKD